MHFYHFHFCSSRSSAITAAFHSICKLCCTAEWRDKQGYQNGYKCLNTFNKPAWFHIGTSWFLSCHYLFYFFNQCRNKAKCNRHNHCNCMNINLNIFQRLEKPFNSICKLCWWGCISQHRACNNKNRYTARHKYSRTYAVKRNWKLIYLYKRLSFAVKQVYNCS